MKKEDAQYLLEKIKENYNQIAKEFSRRRSQVWEEVRFLFDDYITPGDKVLDLGCGNGRFFEILKNKGVSYVGVDFSEKLIEIAKKRYLYPPQISKKFGRAGAKFLVADALNLPFPNNYFDKVYAIAILHHIPSKEFRQRFLEEAKRVLKPRGLLILTCWNLWQKPKIRRLIFKFTLKKIFCLSKLDFFDIQMNWWGIPSYYFHCFTKRELVKVVKKSGFEIIKTGEFLVGIEKKFAPRFPNSNLYIVAKKG